LQISARSHDSYQILVSTRSRDSFLIAHVYRPHTPRTALACKQLTFWKVRTIV
jgi:hypothetical protein